MRPLEVPEVGFEPTRSYNQRILSPLRLPLRHSGKRKIRICLLAVPLNIKPNSISWLLISIGPCLQVTARAFSLYTACSLRCPQGTHTRQQRRWQVYCLYGIFIPFLFREFPRVKRNSSTAHNMPSRADFYGVGAHPRHPTQRDWQFLLILENHNLLSATSIQHQLNDAGTAV